MGVPWGAPIGRSDSPQTDRLNSLFYWESLLCEKVLMEALSYQQAEDHLAEAVLIVRHHLHESNAHRFWPG